MDQSRATRGGRASTKLARRNLPEVGHPAPSREHGDHVPRRSGVLARLHCREGPATCQSKKGQQKLVGKIGVAKTLEAMNPTMRCVVVLASDFARMPSRPYPATTSGAR